MPGIKVGRRGLSYAKRYLLRVAGVIQGLQGWSALVQVRVREALFDKERGESAVCQGCEEGRETPELSALLDFLESPDHLPSSISLPSEVQRVTVAGTRIIWVLKVSVFFVGSLEKQLFRRGKRGRPGIPGPPGSTEVFVYSGSSTMGLRKLGPRSFAVGL